MDTAPQRMTTHSRRSDRGTVITISGSLDATNSAAAACYLEAELDSVRGDVIFDLAAVDTVAPSGVELLITSYRHLALQGRRVRFEGVAGGVALALAALPIIT